MVSYCKGIKYKVLLFRVITFNYYFNLEESIINTIKVFQSRGCVAERKSKFHGAGWALPQKAAYKMESRCCIQYKQKQFHGRSLVWGGQSGCTNWTKGKVFGPAGGRWLIIQATQRIYAYWFSWQMPAPRNTSEKLLEMTTL